MSNPQTSIVMNCFNGASFLREAIESIYAQAHGSWEVVFLDNASTDRSAEIARSYDERLRYFRNETKTSLGAARNIALSHCRGEFIAFLDCDDIWMPDKLEKQLPLFNDPEVGLVFANNRIFSEGGEERLHYRGRNEYATGRCFGRLVRRYFLSMPTVIVRRSALEPLEEWFDPRFQVAEEMDLFLRIAHDWKLAMHEDVLAAYRVHRDSETWKRTSLYLDETLAILGKLRRLYPEFDESFALDAIAMEDHCRFGQAIYLWRTGKGEHARDQLLAMKCRHLRHWCFYGLTMGPFRLVAPALKLLRGGFL